MGHDHAPLGLIRFREPPIAMTSGVTPRQFARIQAVEERDRFRYPDASEFNPERLFERSFGVFLNPAAVEEISFKLAQRWRVFVRTHRWHSSQTTEETGDGVVVRLSVGVCPELEGFLLSFGPECEVLGPPALRERIAQKAHGLSEVYRKASV